MASNADEDQIASSTFLNPVQRIIMLLKDPDDEKSVNKLVALARYPKVLDLLEKYAKNPKKHHITLRSFSRVTEADILKMGVQIFPDISFQCLAHAIRQSDLARRFNFQDVLTNMRSNPILENAGDKAFESISESRARVGVHKIMSEIINKFSMQKAFLVEENIMIARLRSKVAPVEVKHQSGAVVHSVFLTGVLDFLCCSSNVDELLNRQQLSVAFKDWESKSAVPPDAMWKNIHELLVYIGSRAWAFDKLLGSSKKVSQWQLLIVEAKSMGKRTTNQPGKSHTDIQYITTDLGLEVQKLFHLDPDQWLLAHKSLHTLLPSSNGPRSQLDHVVLDRYLSTIWHSSKSKECWVRYMPFDFLQDTGSRPDKSEIDRFRRISGLPTLSECPNCPLEPVIGVIYHGEQYLVVVVPHEMGNQSEEKWIYILGNVVEPFDRCGDQYRLGEGSWKRLLKIGHYHGWNMEDYNVYHVGWNQNKGDSGPIACEVTRNIFKNGFSFKSYIPTYWCTHNIRLNILTTVYTSTVQNLARFPEIRQNQSTTPEYSQYFDSRLEGVEKRLKKFWEDASDPNSGFGFVSISTRLAQSMFTCQHCSINSVRSNDGDTDSDSEDERQEVEDQVLLPECSTPDLPDSPAHALVEGFHRLDISGPPSNLSTCEPQSQECNPNVNAVETVPQQLPGQKSLEPYIYQAIAETLAMHLAPKPDRFQENVMKFCISTSKDWIFGVIDCAHKDRPCYITNTLTHKFSSDNNPTNFYDMITLLLTWMCVPAEEILPYMHDTLATQAEINTDATP